MLFESQDSSDLGRFLSAEAEVGRFDSHGDFTLDAPKAAKKLARFSMPHPYSWVLKLIQAATSFGTDRITVEQSKTTTSFFFQLPPQKVPTPKDLVGTMLQGKLESEEPLNRLCVALRAVVEQSGLSFVVGLRQAVKLETLYAGTYFSLLSDTERERHGACPHPGIRVTVGHRTEWLVHRGPKGPRLSTKLHRKGIAEELHRHAFVTQVPLEIDGHQIGDPLQHPEFGFAAPLRPFLLLALPSFEEEVLPLAGSFQNGLIVPLQASLERFKERAPHPDSAGGWVLLQILDAEGYVAATTSSEVAKNYTFPSEALWVRDGVVIERWTLPLPTTKMMRLVLILNSQGLETDLTGFSLLDTPARKERIDYWTTSAKAAVRSIAYKQLDKLSLSPKTLHAKDKVARRLARRRRLSKQILGMSPFALLDPLLAVGLVAGGLFLQGVHHRFPDREKLEALEKAYSDDFKVSLLQLVGIG